MCKDIKVLLANEVKIFHPCLKLKQSSVPWVPRGCCKLMAGAVQGSSSDASPRHEAEILLCGCVCLETFPASICLISWGEEKGLAR